MPALPPYLIEPIWEQFRALLPERRTNHPLGCHRSRIPERLVFEKLGQVPVFGCAYERIADASCSPSKMRRRRDEWIELGLMDRLREICLEAYDRLIGLELSEAAVDCCVTKAPCGGEKAGRSPVDRGKRGLKRSMAVDAKGIPLGSVSAPANRHDSPLLILTLKAASGSLGALPEGASVHLDRGYDSLLSRERLEELGLGWEISGKGKPAPYWATIRWVVERTSSWHNAYLTEDLCERRTAGVEAPAGPLLGAHRAEANADHDNGIGALYGMPRTRRRSDGATHRIGSRPARRRDHFYRLRVGPRKLRQRQGCCSVR